ncbi:winged helix-turn-helix domain-containing protein [Streptomyces sp. 8L]|uniref:winged helix-turn-helix domain-containing protein n=1 Tax=Streptomyces sp. 8L TaxID=2877242 RepID=UPI001CD23F64|nr:winged helix-turn-helix domain-containing protein [Streptomyces sp. 8L]MCA1217572.1 winged helix-turn-helix domain-containing protein [Streptomyces sp. 8L]
MQQPIQILAEDTADAGATSPRRLRVVATGEPAQHLVTYVVLAPTHLAPEDLFSPQVVVHPSAVGGVSEAGAGRARAPPPPRPPRGRPRGPPPRPGAGGGGGGGGRGPPPRPADRPVELPADRPAPGIRVDLDERTAQVDGKPLDLTYLEFEVLAHFVAHPHLVHSRSRLLELIWGYHYAGDGRTVDVHIARLRRKLGPAHRTTIHTVRRAGYKYVPVRSARA